MINTKEKSLSKLIKEADDAFSLFIRARDSDETGYCRCFTCGKRIHWKREADAAHFNDRDYMTTRYDEINVHSCCIECNRFDKNHHDKYRSVLENRFGPATLLLLENEKHNLMKFTRHELIEIRDTYKAKFKELRKQKGL